jgi:hypothetical protein
VAGEKGQKPALLSIDPASGAQIVFPVSGMYLRSIAWTEGEAAFIATLAPAKSSPITGCTLRLYPRSGGPGETLAPSVFDSYLEPSRRAVLFQTSFGISYPLIGPVTHLDLATRKTHSLGQSTNARFVSLSPDGSRLAHVRACNDEPGACDFGVGELVVLELQTGKETVIGDKVIGASVKFVADDVLLWQELAGCPAQPAEMLVAMLKGKVVPLGKRSGYSGDAERRYTITNDGRVLTSEGASHQQELHAVALDGSGVRRLATDLVGLVKTSSTPLFRLTADGRYAVYLAIGDPLNHMLVRAVDLKSGALTTLGRTDRHAFWVAPSGDDVVFLDQQNGSALTSISPSTMKRVVLATPKVYAPKQMVYLGDRSGVVFHHSINWLEERVSYAATDGSLSLPLADLPGGTTMPLSLTTSHTVAPEGCFLVHAGRKSKKNLELATYLRLIP